MGSSPRVKWVAGAALVLAIGFVFYVRMHREDDKTQILAALDESILASKEGRPGGVMDKLSVYFQINDEAPGSRRQVADFIRNSKPDVTVTNTDVKVFGEEAWIVSPVEVHANFLGQEISKTLKEATIVFKKEDAFEYLVIPVEKWKVYRVEVPEDSIKEFVQ